MKNIMLTADRLKIAGLIHVGILFSSLAHCEEPLVTHGASHGEGVHRAFSFNQWDGKPTIVSSLTKDTRTLLLERTSKTDLVIRDKTSSEVYFKLPSKPANWLNVSDNTVLVDFLIRDEFAIALLCGSDHHYLWLKVERNLPDKVNPPLHILEPLAVRSEKWHLNEVMWVRDFGRRHEMIRHVGLNDDGSIGFILVASENARPDIQVFSFTRERKGDLGTPKFGVTSCLRNGNKANLSSGLLPCLVHEEHERLCIVRAGAAGAKSRVETCFGNKEDAIKWYRDEFTDKQAAEEIVREINKAYSAEVK